MTASRPARRRLVACVLSAGVAFWCFATLIPAAHPFFGLVCHQIPERSFALDGVTLAVCARCTGLYFGFLLGSLAVTASMLRAPGRTTAPPGRAVLLLAALPALVEGVAEMAGLWAGTPAARALTGAVFGVSVPFYFIPAADEMLTEARAEISRLMTKMERVHAATRAR